MVCPNCGAHNNDTTTTCTSCGFVLKKPIAPPIQQSVPRKQEPLQQDSRKAISVKSEPYIAEYIMGLIGSILCGLLFILLFTFEISDFSNFDTSVLGILTAIASLFVLAAFILGIVGTGQVNKGNGKGGVLLIIGGGLSLIAALISVAGWLTVFFFPLLLAAGIMALARRKSVERNKHIGD